MVLPYTASAADYLRVRQIQQRNQADTSESDTSTYLDNNTISMLRRKIQEEHEADTWIRTNKIYGAAGDAIPNTTYHYIMRRTIIS